MTSRIVKTVSRTIIPFIFLFGVYMIFFGHISPGGGFQGGVIVSMGIILAVVAYGEDIIDKYKKEISLIEILGVSFFILAGISGIILGNSFFSSFGAIWALNIIIGMKVCSGIVLFFILFIRWEYIDND